MRVRILVIAVSAAVAAAVAGPAPAQENMEEVPRFTVETAGTTFCMQCRRPGVRLRIWMEDDGAMSAVVRRRALKRPRRGRFLRYGTFSFDLVEGSHAYTVVRTAEGRVLSRADYRVEFTAFGRLPVVARFVVR